MPARCSLCRRFIGARARARLTLGLLPLSRAGVLYGARVVTPYDPHQSILNIIGGQYFERWPDEESRIILHTSVFTYSQRLTALTFLYGNIGDVDLVYSAVRKQLGVDPKDHEHALRFLDDLSSGKYDQKYHYFDVLAADWLFLDGTVNARRTPSSPLARLLHAWDRECARVFALEERWPTLAEQRAFML